MLRFEKRNIIWLAVLSVLMALVVISPNIAPGVQAVLLAVFMLAMLGTVLDKNVRDRLVQTITQPRRAAARNRISPQAREAYERAQQRGAYYRLDLQMIDIGMIASQSSSEGLVMRRTRSISKDDDGVRPFITLFIPPEEADRNARLRFELTDHNGRDQYIREMKVYLRDGEMNILADNHLPLIGNDEIAGMGDWDLRVYIDDALIGIHNFQLTASSEERRQRVQGGRYYVTESEADDEDARRQRRLAAQDRQSAPMSLEDLLRGQGGSEQERR
ncbi:MAG: hypothetical protein ACOCYT_02250 [Chloroflexota bacterium]